MENKHTPGPWKVMYSSKNGESALAVWKNDTQEGSIGSPICKVSPEEMENDEDRANAKLIAAAPDLLEALGFCIALLKAQGIDEHHRTFGENIRMIEDAHKKATV